jgi:transposase
VPRYTLTDEQWQRLEPLLPPEKPAIGRPSISHRKFLNALIWLVRTGAPWRDLPSNYGPWQTISTRFYRWRADGKLLEIFIALREQADAQGLIDWEMHCVDSTVIRAHQHAAGGKKGRHVRSDAAAEGSVRKSICALMAKETRSSSRLPVAKSTTRRRR